MISSMRRNEPSLLGERRLQIMRKGPASWSRWSTRSRISEPDAEGDPRARPADACSGAARDGAGYPRIVEEVARSLKATETTAT